MTLCYLCGASYTDDEIQEVKIDLKREVVCEHCVRKVLLIAGQVRLPGWIAQVWQPRNLSQLASRKSYLLDQEQVTSLCESSRDACLCRLNDAYNEWWNDFGIPAWLDSQKPMG